MSEKWGVPPWELKERLTPRWWYRYKMMQTAKNLATVSDAVRMGEKRGASKMSSEERAQLAKLRKQRSMLLKELK